jgi:hypothetical protein
MISFLEGVETNSVIQGPKRVPARPAIAGRYFEMPARLYISHLKQAVAPYWMPQLHFRLLE